MLEILGLEVPEGLSVTPMTDEERRRRRENAMNESPGSLKYVDCPICRNKGVVFTMRPDGTTYGTACKCMKARRSLQRIAQSGLADMMEAYTMDSYRALDKAATKIKQAAMRYTVEQKGWFFICGRPGSGKTHICTAICGELINREREIQYMLWRETAPKLKALVNEREQYDTIIDGIKNVDVLYIDDFFKGTVTDADVNLAFEIINARYNNRQRLTIISTEKSIEQIMSIDEAVGSRIYERSKGFCLKAPEVNHRLE